MWASFIICITQANLRSISLKMQIQYLPKSSAEQITILKEDKENTIVESLNYENMYTENILVIVLSYNSVNFSTEHYNP